MRSRQPNADVDGTVHFSRLQRQLAGALAADLRHLLATNAKLSLQDIGPVLYGAQEIRRLLDRTLDLARIATEESEYLLDDARARRLRALFMQLMRDHVRIGTWRMQSGKIEVYLERFQAFETTMSHEFSLVCGHDSGGLRRDGVSRNSALHGVVILAAVGATNERTEYGRQALCRHLTATRTKIGLALGSGSARGLAHLGVIRALSDAGIEVDCIAGTSIGALIGAIHAAGKWEELDSHSRLSIGERRCPFSMWCCLESRLIDGARVANMVRAHIHAEAIEALPIPFAAVATDLTSGEEVILSRGDVIEAVRASISVPGIFTPQRGNGRILVDGGSSNPVPVSVARPGRGHRDRGRSQQRKSSLARTSSRSSRKTGRPRSRAALPVWPRATAKPCCNSSPGY